MAVQTRKKTAQNEKKTVEKVVENVAVEEKKPTFSEDEVQRMIAEAVAKAMAEQAKEAPQIIRFAADTEKIHWLWMADVSDYNVQDFGERGCYGRITGRMGDFFSPKNELHRLLTRENRFYIEKRWLIPLSGLDEEEMKAIGAVYKPGELLGRHEFTNIVEVGEDICNIFPALCESHKQIIATQYATEYEKGNPAVTREIVTKLNSMSKKDGKDRGMFVSIIEKMNEKDAQN